MKITICQVDVFAEGDAEVVLEVGGGDYDLGLITLFYHRWVDERCWGLQLSSIEHDYLTEEMVKQLNLLIDYFNKNISVDGVREKMFIQRPVELKQKMELEL